MLLDIIWILYSPRNKISPDMMNLEDVHDMNVGDMVNGYTSRRNASYKEHLLLLLSLL